MYSNWTWSTMECSQPAARTSYRSLLVASRVKAFLERPTNPALPYSVLRTRKSAIIFWQLGWKSFRTPPLLLLRARDIDLKLGPTCSGCSKSIRCVTTSIVCWTCQRHFHVTCSSLTQLQKGIQGFFCFLSSGGAAAQPPTTTVISTSVLPRRCPLCHTKIQNGIRPIMCQQYSHQAHRKCSDISRCVASQSWLWNTCSLSTTSISNQPMLEITNNTHASTALQPTTNIISPFPRTELS